MTTSPFSLGSATVARCTVVQFLLSKRVTPTQLAYTGQREARQRLASLPTHKVGASKFAAAGLPLCRFCRYSAVPRMTALDD